MSGSPRPERLAWKRPLVALLALALLGASDASDEGLDGHEPRANDAVGGATTRDLAAVHAARHEASRAPLRGTELPDGVLALTWDDGPDARTAELARWLHERRVAGTFFVVGEWIDGVSEEPGVGEDVFGTGHRHLPVLAELAALGHRLGNHTANHALLDAASRATVVDQLARNQREIDPFVQNELRMFRAPGGAWSHSSANTLDAPLLRELVGPFHWDIDGKDWESSLYCRAAPDECEPGPIPGRTRVKPEVVARRYVERAESARHGIVLLHDRVGHVGSRYALDVARHLVPALEARGFVFAAPVLEFGHVTPRLTHVRSTRDASLAAFADLDGDGHAELCREELGELACAHGETTHDPDGMPRATFGRPRTMLHVSIEARAVGFADVDGDGHADVCVATNDSVDCAPGGPSGFGAVASWSSDLVRWPDALPGSLRLADVDGDGRADACVRSASAIVCAKSSGRSFERPTVWLDDATLASGELVELADLDGDGRADACGRHLRSGAADGVACALSNGRRFGRPAVWSASGERVAGLLRLGDVNGDGRADVCAGDADGVTCALSDGHGFKHGSRWSTASAHDLRLVDLNGDHRADLCVFGGDRVDCGMAP